MFAAFISGRRGDRAQYSCGSYMCCKYVQMYLSKSFFSLLDGRIAKLLKGFLSAIIGQIPDEGSIYIG